ASGQSATGGVTLSVSLASGQQYFVKVFSPTGSLFTYDLSIAKSGASGGGGGKSAKGGALVVGLTAPGDGVNAGASQWPGTTSIGSYSATWSANGPTQARAAPSGSLLTTFGLWASPPATPPRGGRDQSNEYLVVSPGIKASKIFAPTPLTSARNELLAGPRGGPAPEDAWETEITEADE